MSIQQSLTSAVESIESAVTRIPIAKKVGNVITKDGIKVAPSQKDGGGSAPAAAESPTPVPVSPTVSPALAEPIQQAKQGQAEGGDKEVTDFANNGQRWVYTDPEKAQEITAVNKMGNEAANYNIQKRDNQNDNMTRWSDILRKAAMTGFKAGAIIAFRSKTLDKPAKKYDDKYDIEEVR